MTAGVLYILYECPRYSSLRKQIEVSINSLRDYCDLPITIYTTKELSISADNICVQLSDPPTDVIGNQVIDKRRSILAPKLDYLANLPYDVTIYVDCDTRFYADPSILVPAAPWDFDLAICKESVCTSAVSQYRSCGNWLNTGFMVINDGKPYQELIKRAQDKLISHPGNHDQWAINKAYQDLFEITVKILPQKWNVRDPIIELIDNPCMIHSHKNLSLI